MSHAPRSAALRISSIRTRRPGSGSARSRRNSLWPRMTVRRLLKSCAIPPASWPIASILLIRRGAEFLGEALLECGRAGAASRVATAGLARPLFCLGFGRDRGLRDNNRSADTSSLARKMLSTARGGKGDSPEEKHKSQLPAAQIYALSQLVSARGIHTFSFLTRWSRPLGPIEFGARCSHSEPRTFRLSSRAVGFDRF